MSLTQYCPGDTAIWEDINCQSRVWIELFQPSVVLLGLTGTESNGRLIQAHARKTSRNCWSLLSSNEVLRLSLQHYEVALVEPLAALERLHLLHRSRTPQQEFPTANDYLSQTSGQRGRHWEQERPGEELRPRHANASPACHC
ncbi:hypothetical protein AOLI_G00023940 [Acnodon oligacanthus]